MARQFSFDLAAFHFAKAEGPPGFLMKFLLAYGLGVILIGVLGFFALQPLIEGYLEAFAMMAQGASERQVEDYLGETLLGNLGRVGLGYLLMLIVYAAFWSMMESAVLRRYVREEGFGIRWGADEWRMLAVGLIWFVSIFVAYIALVLGVAVLALPVGMALQDNPGLSFLWTGIVMIGLLLVWAYFAVRLSPAGAMTIRDQGVVFFGAWGATKGRFWPMVGGFLVLAVILYVGILVLYMIGAFTVIGAVMGSVDFDRGQTDPDALMAAFTNPAVLVPLAITYLVMLIYQGFWQYAWAGIPALAAKTDPRTGGLHDAADTF